MEYILFLCFIVAFLATLLITPYWIKRAKNAGLVGKDMHKLKKIEVAEVGGLCVVTGFIFGILTYIAIQTFYFHNQVRSLQIMAILSTILIITLIGLIDDILGWKIGLRQWQKPLLALFASLPIVVINVGHSTMALPFLGEINVGLLYPLVLVPLAIAGASNGFNMIGGYNGLESGLGILILGALGFTAWKVGSPWTSVIALCMFFALVAFYFYNKYPSKVFPGDTLTYPVGALIACVAIVGNMERAALILFIPYFIELILKARGKFKKESFAKLQKDGSLDVPYSKFYGVEHVAVYLLKKIRNKVSEKDLVYSLYAFEIILVLFVIISAPL